MADASALAEAAGRSAGFVDYQFAGAYVPFVQSHLPVAVEDAGGNVAEVQRCRAEAAQKR